MSHKITKVNNKDNYISQKSWSLIKNYTLYMAGVTQNNQECLFLSGYSLGLIDQEVSIIYILAFKNIPLSENTYTLIFSVEIIISRNNNWYSNRIMISDIDFTILLLLFSEARSFTSNWIVWPGLFLQRHGLT